MKSGKPTRSARPSVIGTKIRAVIFDIGKVILAQDPRRVLLAIEEAGSKSSTRKANGALRKAGRALRKDSVQASSAPTKAASGDDAQAMWLALQQDPMWHDWQEGRVAAREWHANVCKRFGLKVGFEDFCWAWNCVMLPEPILPDRLFVRLARRVKLVLLSNTDEIHVAHMESAFTFPRYFAARIYSNQVHASKPGRKIFQAGLRAAGTQASETLFIDDVKKYVLAARKMGMRAVQFKSKPQLEAVLRRLKLL